MSFISLIFKNPFRNKTRSALAVIGIAIGIVGGLYPAIRASRLSPTEALRYE